MIQNRTLGTALRHLLALLDDDLETLYRADGLGYRPRYTPIVRALIAEDGLSIRAIAALAGITHSAVSQTITQMKRDGWVENPLPGASDWSAVKRYGFRVAALWEPTDNVSVQYAYDNSTDKSTGGYPHIEYLLPGAPPLAPIFSVDGERTRDARAGFVLDPSVGKVKGHMLQAEWEISDTLTLRSITAYRKINQTQYDNSSGLFLAYRPNGLEGRLSFAEIDQDQFSQEFQLVGTTDRLNYVLGAFYFDEDASDIAYAPFTARFNADGTALNTLPTPFSSTQPSLSPTAFSGARTSDETFAAASSTASVKSRSISS